MLRICRSKKFKLVKVMIKAIKYQPKQTQVSQIKNKKFIYYCIILEYRTVLLLHITTTYNMECSMHECRDPAHVHGDPTSEQAWGPGASVRA